MKTKALIFSAFVIALGLGYSFGSSAVKPVQAATFSHENCQYPERDTNPADGCDNSDPAIPECIGKTGSGEQNCTAFVDKCLKAQPTQSYELLQSCLKQYQESLNPVTAPIVPVVTPPSEGTTPVVTCK